MKKFSTPIIHILLFTIVMLIPILSGDYFAGLVIILPLYLFLVYLIMPDIYGDIRGIKYTLSIFTFNRCFLEHNDYIFITAIDKYDCVTVYKPLLFGYEKIDSILIDKKYQENLRKVLDDWIELDIKIKIRRKRNKLNIENLEKLNKL